MGFGLTIVFTVTTTAEVVWSANGEVPKAEGRGFVEFFFLDPLESIAVSLKRRAEKLS